MDETIEVILIGGDHDLRDVFTNDLPNGKTGRHIVVPRGRLTISLGDPKDYRTAEVEVDAPVRRPSNP